jgi:hypothetical protein
MNKEALLNHLLRKFAVSTADLARHRDYYNNHFTEYENDIYDDVKTRLVHL